MEKLYVENGRLMAGGAPLLLRGFGLGGWLLPEGYMWKFYTKCDRPRRIEALIEEPVSYTHLDVYKRQILYWQCPTARYAVR